VLVTWSPEMNTLLSYVHSLSWHEEAATAAKARNKVFNILDFITVLTV